MEVAFYTGKESEKYWRDFADKLSDFILRELRDYRVDDLKALLRILKEDNRTFEESA